MNASRFGLVLLLVVLGLCVSERSALAEDWPQFRGATGSGISAEKNLPEEWSADSAIWVTPLTGRSNSSPAVTSKRIDLTTQKADHSLWVISLDRKSGKVLRSTKVGSGTLVAKGPKNLYGHRHNSATPSPAADEENTYAFFGTGILVCVEAASGEVKWKRDLVKDYGEYDITFGMGSSPRLWGDLVYVACMTKGASYVVAINKRTGETQWKTERTLPAKDDGPDSYSTPTILERKGRRQLLVSGSDHVDAYDLVKGKRVWFSSGLTIESPYGRIIASPVASAGVVLATSGNPAGAGKGHMLAVRPTSEGDISAAGRLWTYPKTTPDSSTPIALNGRVYMAADNGVATCLDLMSGKMLWQKRLSKGPYHASLVAGDGKVYFLGIDGNCTVIAEGGEQAEVIATNQLSGTFYSTPAISEGKIYFRAYERMYAVGVK